MKHACIDRIPTLYSQNKNWWHRPNSWVNELIANGILKIDGENTVCMGKQLAKTDYLCYDSENDNLYVVENNRMKNV